MGEQPAAFAGLLRRLRAEARLTQEELAEVSGVRPRTVSDLERGVATTPQRETIRRLADALNLIGLVRTEFEAVARGRPLPGVADGAGAGAAEGGAAGGGGVAAATRTLPRDVASFTGRGPQLQELMDAAANPGGVVGIHAIGGMAGIGKTAFAVHAAHRLADRFPDGQVFLPLHGHTPGQRPVSPGDALASLLLTVGVPAGQVPPDPEARAALWRDRLAGKRLLLVLDDAAGTEQVRPLLPGTDGSLVLVTSRRHLSALDDATAISLGTLPAAEAAALLARLAGRPGLSADDPAVREITRLCGYLPLAIGMVARQLRHHPAWTPAGRAAELAAARDRLGLMTTENLSVAAAFDLSYADLTDDQQRLFRRLGLHPGGEFDAYAAAALDAAGLTEARRGLEALYDQYLLTEPAQGRYRMHDLIREYARALAGRLDADDDGEQATARLLDYYQRAGARAGARLGRQARPSLPPPAPASPELDNEDQALAWARVERANLLACLDQATAAGQHARVIALTAALGGLLRRDGPWADAITRHTVALQAAQHLGDLAGQASALDHLGDVRRLTGDFPAAGQALEQALIVYRDLGDRAGQAGVLTLLGDVHGATDEFPAAALVAEQALVVYRDLGDRRGQASALTLLGNVRWVTGDYPAAVQTLKLALDTYRDIGNRLGQAHALSDLGQVWTMIDDYPAAAEALEQALVIYRDLGDRLGQANALLHLGSARKSTGDLPAAAQALEQALETYRDIGHRLGQANALGRLGDLRRLTGDYPAAAAALELALGMYRDIGNRLGQANVLVDLGGVREGTGDFPAAALAMDQALAICRDIGNRGCEVRALNGRGRLHRVSTELAQAEACHDQALDLAREIASPLDEAHALAGLGRCALAAGQAERAEALLRQALEAFQRLGAPETPGLRAEIAALASPQAAG